MWGGTLTYHRETETLHLIGGLSSTFIPSLVTNYPSYKYSIQSNTWHTSNIRDMPHSLIFSSAQSYKEDYSLIFGGMYVTSISSSASTEDCFSNVIGIFNVGILMNTKSF